MRVAVIAQSKGGTGKTTTAVQIAFGLAMEKAKKVLLIDCDPQGNVSNALGVSAANTLYHVIVEKASLEDCIVRARPNLDLIAANRELTAADQWLVMQHRREEVLRRRLEEVEGYDYIILDTAPSFSLVGLNALLFAQEVWIPVSMEYLALEGVRQVVGNLRVLEEELHHVLPIHYVIPTFYDGRHKKSAEVLSLLKEAYGNRVTDPIRIDVKLSEAPSFFKTVFEYSPHSRGAEDFRHLIERIVNDGINEYFSDRKESAERHQGGLGSPSGAGGELPGREGIIYYAQGNPGGGDGSF